MSLLDKLKIKTKASLDIEKCLAVIKNFSTQQQSKKKVIYTFALENSQKTTKKTN